MLKIEHGKEYTVANKDGSVYYKGGGKPKTFYTGYLEWLNRFKKRTKRKTR